MFEMVIRRKLSRPKCCDVHMLVLKSQLTGRNKISALHMFSILSLKYAIRILPSMKTDLEVEVAQWWIRTNVPIFRMWYLNSVMK